MLQFYPEQKPHTPYFEEMTDYIPSGGFYLKTLEMVARSSLPAKFTLITDTQAPVYIYINNVLVKTVVPTGRETVEIPLAVAPHKNDIKVTNGIDPDVHLSIASTYLATYMETIATQHYEVAGKTVEKYYDLLKSPWNSFIAEWLSPWHDLLPDIHTLRSLAVKLQTNVLYNEAGRERGTINFVSGFSCSTPVIQEYRNPEDWQPILYQPVNQSDDTFTYDLHVWLPNLCISRWASFVTLINNLKNFTFKNLSETVVLVHDITSEFTTQHVFDLFGNGCSLNDILSIGCMDNLIMSGFMEFTNRSSFCYWSRNLDSIVEYPGIGGRFLDIGTFDLSGHITADDTNRLLRLPAIDLQTAYDLVSDFITKYNAHDNDPTSTWHHSTGGSHQITSTSPYDIVTLRTACLEIQTKYAEHLSDSSMHNPIDDTYTLDITISSSAGESELLNFCNELLVKYNDHITFASFDTLYDADKLTDYWVGASTSKALDTGSCFDTSPIAISPENLSCCTEGPDTKTFCTDVNSQDITSSVTPNHPVFGGDDPGLLFNPYFSIL